MQLLNDLTNNVIQYFIIYGRIWGFISRPSFSAEESVYCVRTASGYKLVMRRAEKNIWNGSTCVTAP